MRFNRKVSRYAPGILLLFFLSGVLHADVDKEVGVDDLQPTRDHRQSALIISRVIERYHYRQVELDDQLSQRVLQRYQDSLDPNKSFFVKTDIDGFQRYNDILDDSIKEGNVAPAFDIFRRFRQRVDSRIEQALQTLKRGEFDFTVDEDYRFDREDAEWAKDEDAVSDLWRRRVKNDYLSLKLGGKEPDKIVSTLSKRYENIRRRTHQFTANEIFELFINSYTQEVEPHTSYMSPKDSEDFDINMRLSLQGIGAELRNEDEYTVIQRTIAGGPAKGSGQIRKGDRIVGVAQGNDGEMVDVIGWRLKDVVDKIRGPKGSTVRLHIIPKSRSLTDKPKEVKLVRDEIKLENKAAKAEVLENLEGLQGIRIGVIDVPAFYRDFRGQSTGKKDFRSTTRDVRKLIKELEQKAVDGIVVDLRGNGGGALTEATELTGLFIEQGPVVQVKDTRGEVEIERDTDPEKVYSGPLAVLVDRNSASASEIFAGAIQDYRRGLIIGEPTFGKGTVQSLVSLGQFTHSGKDLGRLRLTIAQFFRIQGGSTQHRGVMPDIVYPTVNISSEYGERSLENALPWAAIDAVDHPTLGLLSVANLRTQDQDRISSDPGFRFLVDQEKEIEEIRERTTVSLLEEKRKQENEQREQRRLDRLNALRVYRGLPSLTSLDDDEEDAGAHAGVDDDEDDEEGIQKIMLEEAARILADFIEQNRPITAQAG